MGTSTMAIVIQVTIIDGLKSLIFTIPLLITVYFYRKKVCYQCEQEDCPFHFRTRGNLRGFLWPGFLMLILALVLVFFYNFI